MKKHTFGSFEFRTLATAEEGWKAKSNSPSYTIPINLQYFICTMSQSFVLKRLLVQWNMGGNREAASSNPSPVYIRWICLHSREDSIQFEKTAKFKRRQR